MMPSLCNLLVIAWQILYNHLINAWTTGNHLSGEGTHTHCITNTQVNGNTCWHCHGKCLSRLSAIWLDMTWKAKKKKSVTSGSGKEKNTCQETCCNLDDQMFVWCKCQIQNTFPHLMNNSSGSNCSRQCNTAKNVDIACGTSISL